MTMYNVDYTHIMYQAEAEQPIRRGVSELLWLNFSQWRFQTPLAQSFFFACYASCRYPNRI